MCNLDGKNIVLGITGGIAAYKSLSLIRLFKAHHCEVKVVATRHALQFVTPLTIETLSQNKLYLDTFEQTADRNVHHIAFSEWADCMVVAPATANIIAKFANGIADDALSTLFLAMRCPLFLAPAMNNRMFDNELVQQNIKKLQNFGMHVIEPQSGFLACGTEGKGRMEEPEAIFERIKYFFNESSKLKGKKAMVSAGPTYEPIDPVRFIGNHSSGLMGYAVAEQLANCGAEVILISGPTHLQIKHSLIQRIDVNTAAEMHHACMRFVADSDVMVMAAAVADYTPRKTALEKIKKHEEGWSLPLMKTADILSSIGKLKKEKQFLVGFALETENELENAKLKMQNKNADMIVLNSMRNPGAGFKKNTNQVTILMKNGEMIQGDLKNKEEVAKDIVEVICNHLI